MKYLYGAGCIHFAGGVEFIFFDRSDMFVSGRCYYRTVTLHTCKDAWYNNIGFLYLWKNVSNQEVYRQINVIDNDVACYS